MVYLSESKSFNDMASVQIGNFQVSMNIGKKH